MFLNTNVITTINYLIYLITFAIRNVKNVHIKNMVRILTHLQIFLTPFPV